MKNIVIGVASAIVLVLLLCCIYTLQGGCDQKNGILRFHYTGNGECGSKDDRG